MSLVVIVNTALLTSALARIVPNWQPVMLLHQLGMTSQRMTSDVAHTTARTRLMMLSANSDTAVTPPTTSYQRLLT